MKYSLRNRLRALRPDPRKIRSASVKVISFAVIGGVFILLAWTVKEIFTKTDFFNIRDIKLVGARSDDVNLPKEKLIQMVKDTHIKDVDLSSFHKRLMSLTPQIKQATVIKEYPNRLLIKVTRRKPIAQIGAVQYYLVDKDGLVFSRSYSVPQESLPIIKGLDVNISKYTGRKCNSQKLRQALNLVMVMYNTRFNFRHEVVIVDASDRKNILFYIEDGVEVRIGSDNFNKRLNLLSKTLQEAKPDLSRVKYIDTRFDGIVIGPR